VGNSKWIDRLHVEAAVSEVQRDSILQETYAAPVEGALEARTADRDARLVGAEARLRDDTR